MSRSPTSFPLVRPATLGSIPGMIDARERVTGRVPYTIDIALPRMLQAKLLRSTMAHARIASIDVSRARAVPGVLAVLTGADLAARPNFSPYFGPIFRDQPALAIGKVRFIGEPVAAVAALDADIAQEAVDAIDVEYEELPGVFDLVSALAPDAPLIHETRARTGGAFAHVPVAAADGTNICSHFKLRKGDVERGFAEAVHVFEDVFTSPPVQHVPMETHACVADVRSSGITVWTSSQNPFGVRLQLADMFHLPQGRVRVVIPTLGGSYGAKCFPYVDHVAVLLAEATGRPVRLVLTREEEFHTITRHGMRIRMKTGVRADGTIVARQSTCHFNTGAYADSGPLIVRNGGYGTGGPYHIPNLWVDSYAVYTNIVPAGSFRGPGVSQAAWAYDTQMDMIADRIGLDPYEFRMRNLVRDGETVMTGGRIEDAHFRELLGSAASWIGWDPAEAPVRQGSKVRAKGLSCIIKGSVNLATSTASAKLSDDGSLQVLTSSVEMGQGLLTAMAILASEGLSVPIERVRISTPDTDVTPYDHLTSSSRSTRAMGLAMGAALDEIRAQILALAAEALEANSADLELVDGFARVKGSPDGAISYGELIRRSRAGNLLGSGTSHSEGGRGLDPETGQGLDYKHWHQAAAAAEVEVDLETGRVSVPRYHAGVYSGRTVNPVQAELQTEGNVAFGLGQALFEEMVYDGGQLVNGNLADYMVPSIEDMPGALHVEVLEHREANEIHGLGETALPAVMPAIGNAVYRATGVRILDLPITAEKVLRGLRARAAEGKRAGTGAGDVTQAREP